MSDPVKEHGFTAVQRDPQTLLGGNENIKTPEPILVSDVHLPDTPLVKNVMQYAKQELPAETFNHRFDDIPSAESNNAGQAIAQQQFPEWQYSPETYLLTCLLHDIGATPKNLRATLLSFEFFGGILALELLRKEFNAPRAQAEAVCEAIVRHQDLGETGCITTIGRLVQLATVFDNLGGNKELVHQGTIDDVTARFPRLKWSSCFATTIREEVGIKPWSHTTALDEFAEGVEGNELMRPYE
ncbi:MAG: hypothetical protein M1836_003161 [Candelina mexicana]|nr:MAG: hypothetical protein M1836_003161 [Candelina mexicana]